MNYSELLQLAKGWGNFISDRIIIWRLPYMWVYCNIRDHARPAKYFEHQPGRGGRYPEAFLKGYTRYIHTYAYCEYNGGKEITRCLCYIHLRRAFVDALPKDIHDPKDSRSAQALLRGNKLFAGSPGVHA